MVEEMIYDAADVAAEKLGNLSEKDIIFDATLKIFEEKGFSCKTVDSILKRTCKGEEKESVVESVLEFGDLDSLVEIIIEEVSKNTKDSDILYARVRSAA